MKILIADDTSTSRMLAATILEKRGHEVTTVGTGQAAIEMLMQEDFDLVLMDIQMPGISGIDTTRIIRDIASPVRQHDVPILAVSAGSDSDHANGRQDCLCAGMNGYISKPVRSKELIEIVERFGGRVVTG